MATLPPFPIVAVPKFDATLGALLIGGLVATALYGMTVLQTFTFFMGDTTDRVSHKALVAFLLWVQIFGDFSLLPRQPPPSVLDTFDTLLNGHILYFYLVTNYLAPQAIAIPVWSLIIHVAATSLSNFIVRRYRLSLRKDLPLTSDSAFTRRVYRLSNGNIPGTLWIISLSILDLICGLIITAKAFRLKTFFEVEGISTLMYLNFAAGTSSDLSVALALCYLLRGSRTGFQRTDSLIGALMMYTVNTGLLVALDATAGMVAFIFMHDNFIFLGFYLLLSKLYLNSYLAILNARRTLRDKLDEPKSVHLSRIHSAVNWRSGAEYDPERQRSNSQPTVAVSRSDNDTILDISLNANPGVEKSKEIAECPYIARAY